MKIIIIMSYARYNIFWGHNEMCLDIKPHFYSLSNEIKRENQRFFYSFHCAIRYESVVCVSVRLFVCGNRTIISNKHKHRQCGPYHRSGTNIPSLLSLLICQLFEIRNIYSLLNVWMRRNENVPFLPFFSHLPFLLLFIMIVFFCWNFGDEKRVFRIQNTQYQWQIRMHWELEIGNNNVLTLTHLHSINP